MREITGAGGGWLGGHSGQENTIQTHGQKTKWKAGVAHLREMKIVRNHLKRIQRKVKEPGLAAGAIFQIYRAWGGEIKIPVGQDPSPQIKQNGRQVAGTSQAYFSQVKDSESP